jgi:general secretion pathway protein H
MRETANTGFTLLELLVVVTILALMSALVGVNLAGDRSDLESIARTLVTDLRYVRSRAMVGNVDTALVVDLAEGAYYSRAANIDRPLPDSVALELTVDRRDTDGQQGKIVFYPDGSSSGGKLRLTRNGRSLDITTAWLNGYVSLQE